MILTQSRKGAKVILLEENFLSKVIVDSAIEVHRTLGGPGLLENIYQEALVWELKERSCQVEREKHLPIRYKGQLLGNPLRIDLLVGGLVIVECKASEMYHSIYEAQLLTYLRLTGLKLGMVVNFGNRLLKHGIHRVVNGL
jgi:GxxExxY protein